MTDDDDHLRRRLAMVEMDLQGRGLRDPAVLRAMSIVPRERFVPADLARSAYDDHALPIADGQTISQPFIVAEMAEAAELSPGDRVLEVGTGSGYGAAVLREAGATVVTIERHPSLAATAAAALAATGYADVEVVVGDGPLGCPDRAPFDAIIVTAAGPAPPRALLDQLAEGGRLVIPVGPRTDQRLLRLRRRGDDIETDDLGGVRFVPLVGDQGWPTP